ncbi:hypothetical protein [Nocardia sp. NBC_00403]|uniref:hypothetical protein n=1 Tax=Nocardia sp. NBC_00403 TaxID=2975990 RepID=UPI002E1E2CC9
MNESLRVDADLLRALAPELTALADLAHKELTQLKATLEAEGQCWGDDEPGLTFGESYVPEAEKGLAGYANLVENLHRTSGGVVDAADAFHNHDQDIGNQLRNLQRAGVEPGWHTPTPSFDQPIWPNPGSSPSALHLNGSASNPGLGTSAGNLSGTSDRHSRYEQPQIQPQHPDYDTSPGRRDGQPIDQAPGSIAPRPARDSAPPPARDPAPPPARDSAPPDAAGARSGRPERTAVAGKPLETPWSGPSAATPWQRKVAGTPGLTIGAGAPAPRSAPGGVPPGRVFPPQPGTPAPGAARPAKRTKAGRSAKTRRPHPIPIQPKHVETDQAAMEVARALAARHGLRIVGFETAGISERTVHEIAAAVDDILGKYPFLDLGGIEITELGGHAVSDVKWDLAAGWIILDRTAVANPTPSVPGSDEPPMYSTIVNDLGRILEATAGPRTRQRAQASLITEYWRISGPWNRTDTLAHIVAGYRKWRAQLSGHSFSGSRFEPRAALVEAFTEVELRGDKACGPAKVLHQLVVENARGH